MLDSWLPPGDANRLLGGEGCMWTEFVDSANIYARIFPKLLATAERLWSNPNKNNVEVNIPKHLLDPDIAELKNRTTKG